MELTVISPLSYVLRTNWQPLFVPTTSGIVLHLVSSPPEAVTRLVSTPLRFISAIAATSCLAVIRPVSLSIVVDIIQVDV